MVKSSSLSLTDLQCKHMSEAMSPSIGSVAGAVAAGPSVGTGPSMSGEIGASGIGFDGGSPSFSGLGRSDTGLGSFSVNEGPVGPVSFSNSTDLFAETKAITSPTFSVPEGPVRGDIFGQTEFIAQAQSLISDSARRGLVENISPSEPISIFDNTSPFQAMMPVNEGPIPSFSFKDTVEIAGIISEPASAEPIFEISAQPEVNVESILESIVSSQAELEDFSAETVKDAIEDLGAEDTAVDRAGLIERIHENTEPDQDSEVEVDTEQTQNKIDSPPAVTTRVNPETDEETPEFRPEKKKESKTVRDEGANKARIENRNSALRKAFEEEADPLTGKVEGKAVLEKIMPTDDEQSKLAKEAGVDDGAISEGDKIIAATTFDNEEQGETVIFQAVTDNTGVEEGMSGIYASQDEVAKVLRGKSNVTGKTELPLAA